MSLYLNITAMFADTVGEKCGLRKQELDALHSVFSATRADLKQRHEAGSLPFWDLPFRDDMIAEVNKFAAEARCRFTDFVLLGIGGSALGPIALHQALNHLQHNLLTPDRRKGCRFFCPDNVDPDYLGSVLDVVDPAQTLFNVVSKSGGTAETASQFLLILDVLKKRLGDKWRDHLALTTDPKSGLLRQFADREGIQTFPIDPGVGGRFCVLTPVGLLPAAMTGIDISELCRGAGALCDACFRDSLEENPAALFAALLYLAQTARGLPIHVMFAYSNRLYPVADWFRQLWAESLGKRYALDGREIFTGPTPVKAVGATDQHSQVQLYVEGPFDKAVIFLGTREFGRKLPIPDLKMTEPDLGYLQGAELGQLLNAERRATAYALARAGRPNMTLELDRIDAAHIGALLYLLEAATLYAGGFYGVNPLDQPGVEAGKKATYALMGRAGYEKAREEMEGFSNRVGMEMEVRV